MKTLVFALSLLVFPFVSQAQMAQYEFQLKGNEIELKFMIHRTELIQFQINECDIQAETAECTTLYLGSRSSFSVNGMELDFELNNYHMQGTKLVMYLRAPAPFDEIQDLSITTDAFYEFNPSFRNLYILNIGPFQGSRQLTIDNPSLDLSQEN
ncbi:hypothetical protein KFE98_15935 [bacterium SCSIO 12741]|nr:hypothetical protein KFE98_15935 [bacterium SCSIO 12741]